MFHLNASVDIKAKPREVFSLVEDITYRTRLNPNVWVLGIAKETEGPVNVGTVFLFRLVIEGKIIEHRSECTTYIPGKMLETVSDTTPRFNVRVSVEPIPGGTRLTHEESFSLLPMYMPLPRVNGVLGKLFKWMFGDAKELIQSPESVAADETQLEKNLQPRLMAWLYKIKAHLEQHTFYEQETSYLEEFDTTAPATTVLRA